MSESLKPCPFCGARDQKLNIKAGMIDGEHPVSAVHCMACGGSGAYAEIQEHAIESWNRRYPDETPAPAACDCGRHVDGEGNQIHYPPCPYATPPEAARRWWLIHLDDADMRDEVFDDEAAARERYRALLDNWNCHLFVEDRSAGGGR